MPLRFPALSAFALAAALMGAAQAEDLCKVDRAAVAADAAKVGIAVDLKLEPLTKSDTQLQYAQLGEALEREGQVVFLQLIDASGAVVDQIVLCGEPFGLFEPIVLDWAKSGRYASAGPEVTARYRGAINTVKFRLR